jgi:hypothetical protein
VGKPPDGLAQAFDAGAMGEVSVGASPKKVILELDADDTSGLIPERGFIDQEDAHYGQAEHDESFHKHNRVWYSHSLP